MGELGQLINFSERVRQMIITIQKIQIFIKESSLSSKNIFINFLVTIQCNLMDLYEAVLSQLEEVEYE